MIQCHQPSDLVPVLSRLKPLRFLRLPVRLLLMVCLSFPPLRDPQLISGPDIEFSQNTSDDDLTDNDDDLPSVRDILERKRKRNPEIIDLTAEDDVVNALNKLLVSRDLTLAGLKPLITPVSSPGDNHR
jgi:hypothetical protein